MKERMTSIYCVLPLPFIRFIGLTICQYETLISIVMSQIFLESSSFISTRKKTQSSG